MTAPALFSSARGDWETPQHLFDALNAEFGFTLDAAASDENAKCDVYLTELSDSLRWDWSGLADGAVWLNPPYSRKLAPWLAKAAETAERGTTVVCLIPARTSNAWWHTYVWDSHAHRPLPGVEVRFLRGRLTFVGAAASAPFPSAVVIFHAQTP